MLLVYKTKDDQNDAVTLLLQGELDISTIGILQQHIQQLEDISKLIIHLSRLSFIDSTGIGAILELIYLSKENGFSIELQGMNDNIREVLETIGILRVLEAVQRGGS
jgi:anti-anti-sigma factor